MLFQLTRMTVKLELIHTFNWGTGMTIRTRTKANLGRGVEQWGTPELTEGQFLSEYRQCGRDGAFQAHLAQRHLLIAFHRIARPIAEPILNALTRALTRG